ncbi:MAG: CHAT domain-containing protein [Ardenticatenaceae bacterium]
MSPEIVAERLLTEYGEPDFEQLVEQLKPYLTLELIQLLKKRVDEKKLQDAHQALDIATLIQSLASRIPSPEAEPLAYWAKGAALLHLSRYQEALECYEAAAAIYAAQKQALSLVGVQTPMVAILRNLGKHHDALELAEKVRATSQALGVLAQRSLASLEANVGVIYRQIGDPEAALQAYQRARDIFAQLGNEIQMARIDINKANILRAMSRFQAAQKLLLSARDTFAQSGQHVQQMALVNGNLGLLAYLRGQYQEALTHFEAARQSFVGMHTLIAKVDLRCVLIYRKLNLIPELIDLALSAEPIFAQNGMLEEQARALYQQGVGYQLLGASDLAESKLTKARQLLQQQEMQAILFELDYDLANLAHERGRLDEAQQLVQDLSGQIESNTWPRLAAQVRLLLAKCALSFSQTEQADQYAQVALELANFYSLREITIGAHHLMGQISERDAQLDKAWEHYQTAMQLIESLRVQLLVDELRIGFMDNKLPIYEDAIRLSQQIATPAQLLYTLNLAHTAPLLFMGSPTDQTDTQLQQELASLRERWHWYQNKLEEASSQQDAVSIVAELRPQLNKIEAELAELTRRWQVRHTSNFRLLPARNEEHVDSMLFDSDAANQFLANIQHNLSPEDVLLHYYLINDTFQALVVTSEKIHLLPDLAQAKPLARILSGWRFHLTQSHLITQAPERSRGLAQRYLARLHQALVAPLQSHLAFRTTRGVGDTHLFVVMPPGWHDLPLSASFDGQQYLIERYQLTYLSAPEVLLNGSRGANRSSPDVQSANPSTLRQAQCIASSGHRKLSEIGDPRALIVGHSDGGRLTGTLQAAQTVTEQLHADWQTTLLMNGKATMENFQAASRESNLIHLATHATFRADNPLFSWIRLAKHRLTVAELYQMKLPQNPLVVLSACETGRGQARGGGLLGMGRALLAAGASGVVVTLWRVEDQATAQLMINFYGQLESKQHHIAEEAAPALRHAQLQAIARQQHPFFWAGFIFIQA